MTLMLLVGTSSAGGWTVYYVNSTNWNKLYIHYLGGTNPSPSSWGDNPPMVVQGEKVLGFTIYSYEIGDNTSCIFKDNKGDTKNKTGDLKSLQPDKPYYYDGKWYSIREIYEKFWMFYMYQSYGGTLCLKADNNTVASNTTTQMATSGYAYVVVEKTKVDGKILNVSNNCGDWNGTGGKTGGVDVGTEKVHPGCFYKTGASNTITKASTLSSLSIASSINKADANSVAIKVKSTSSTSSYSNGNTNYALKAMFYVDNKYYGTSNQLSTSETSTTLDLSDLADGQHTLSVVLTDGKIYYSDSKTTTFTIVSCTPPGAPELTNPTAQCGGSITLPAKDNNKITLKWYDALENGNVVNNTTITSSGIYYAAAVGECESTGKTAYTVTINPIPSFTVDPTNLSLCKGSTTVTDLTELSHVVVENGDHVWYDAETAGNVVTTGADLENGGTYWVAAENNETGCVNTKRKSFTLKIYDLPKYPDLTKNSAVVCQADETVNLNTLAGVNDVIWYQGEDEVQKPDEISIDEEGIFTYTAKAVNANGCQSATGVDFKLTVNPLPTINIGEDVTAVKFEDVELTATGENIHKVEWTVNKGTITEDATDPKKAVLTYDQTGTVTVTAIATSAAGCKSTAATKTVKFDEEDCTPVPSNDIKITFKTPSNNGKNGQYWGLGTLYYKKDDGSSYTNVKLYEGTCEGGEQTSQEVTISNLQNNATVYFKACYDYSGYTATTKKLTLTKGNKYIIGIISNENPSSTNSTNKTSEVGIEVTSKVSLTNGPEIKAPAVKMVSAEYDEVNDKIVAKGAVYKTGCGTTFWGFQYSTDGQTWGTAETDYIRPNSGNSLTKAGEFEYSFAIPNAGGGDIYYIRAYALNNYNGSYALSNAVYSATSLPVEIPSKTIESATISLVDSEGNPSTNSEVCPQSTVYLKVSYVGGDFKSFEAADNFPGTDLELVNHDKVNNYAIFSYTATSTGVANITISNENTSVTPETGVNIAVKEVAVATPPTIYLEKNTICETQTTNVVVNSPIVGLSYSLKNGSVGDPVTYESGDLKFSVSKEGSYTVQVQETVCGTTAISAPVDLRVITSDVKITLTTDVNTINPWQPLTLTVKAPSGYDYDLQGLDGTVYTKSGDVYTIKFPRPDSWGVGNSASESEPKTFTAGIKAGEEPSCSTTTKEIQLVDTEEVCLAPGN